MGRNQVQWRLTLVLLLLLAAAPTQAGPYIGEWGWCWKPDPNCPKGEYCFLHYWTPTWYRVKYCVHPAYIDQYPPGVPVPVGWTFEEQRCRSIPSMPSAPYADPAGFYGRSIVPSDEESKEKPDVKETK
jgi:hypothetical protein